MESKLPYNLIKLFDGITWIPTIKGRLSYDLLANPECLMGDRDKQLVHYKTHNGGKGEHYVVANSLCTFEDDFQKHKSRKCNARCPFHPSRHKDKKVCENQSYCEYSKKYNHTFRFIFIGSNSRQNFSQDIKDNLEDGKINLLSGALYILPQLGRKTGREISTVLNNITRISQFLDTQTPKQFSQFIESDLQLKERNRKFKELWKNLEESISRAVVESQSSKYPRPIAKFNLLMKLNGILLIKNSTDDKNARYFFGNKKLGENSDADIPMHRIFKTVGSYMKFMFHKNYNHHDKNDSYTPVSNISYLSSGQELENVAMHQLKAMLSPVVQLRRDLYKNCYCNPVGILGYAKTYLECVYNEKWISKKDYSTQKELLCNLKEDVESGYQHTSNSILDFLTAQYNPLAIAAVIITFVLAAKELIVLFDPHGTGLNITSGKLTSHQEYWLIIFLSAIFGFTLIRVTTLFMRKSYFKTAPTGKTNMLYRIISRRVNYNSRTETVLPLPYRIWLSYVSAKTSFNIYRKKYFTLAILILTGVLLLALLILLLSRLG